MSKKFIYHIHNKKIIPSSKMYFDGNRVKKFFPPDKYNLYIIYGAGGIGKTTWMRSYREHEYKEIIKKNPGIEDVNNKFALLTRTEAEVELKKKDIFGNFDDWATSHRDFYIKSITQTEKNTRNGIKVVDELNLVNVGSFVDINNASKLRGGKSYDDYKYFMWDEFMDEHKAGVANETDKLLSLITTIFRNKDMECWFFSNFVGKDTTLFNILGFNPDWIKPGQQCSIPSKGAVFIHMESNKKLLDSYENSTLLKIAGKDNEYLKGRLHGNIYKDNDLNVERQDKGIWKPYANVIFLNNSFGVYKQGSKIKFKKTLTNGNTWPLSKEDAVKNNLIWTGIDRLYPWWSNLYNTNRLLFENTEIKEIIQTFLIKYK